MSPTAVLVLTPLILTIPPHPSIPRQPTDYLFVSLPNDTLYTTMCFLWGGEMASCSQVCRELYNVIGETVVSGFLQEFGGRHPRRMMRNVLFRMYEKARVRSMSNIGRHELGPCRHVSEDLLTCVAYLPQRCHDHDGRT